MYEVVPSSAGHLPAEETIVGPLLAEHRLLRRIGRGSYGEVWLAQNVLGTHRAVKRVSRRDFDSDRPFEREYEGIRKFEPVSRTHEGLVDILQVGRSDASFYYVMELADDRVSGRNFGWDIDTYIPHVLDNSLRMPVEECLRVGLRLTEALAHLHAHGLVHRDVKPANVILVKGEAKLADIGLVTDADAARTFVGTEGFVPPEGGGTVQADLYALGKLLYEIGTGKDRREYPSLPVDFADWPDRVEWLELQEVVDRACSPDVGDRYAEAGEMARDIRRVISGRSVRGLNRMRWVRRHAVRAGAACGVILLAMGLGLELKEGWRGWSAPRMSRVESAITSYSMGLYHAEKRTAVGDREAIVELERALELDSEFAEARGELARVLTLQARTLVVDVDATWLRARDEAQIALRKDPRVFPALAALAVFERDYRRDLSKSEIRIREAIQIRPENAFGPYILSQVLSLQERHDEALTVAREAVRLDPTSPMCRANVAGRLVHSGRIEEAVDEYILTNQLHPTFFPSHEDFAFLLLRLGRIDEAVPILERAWGLSHFDLLAIEQRRSVLREGGAMGFFNWLADFRIQKWEEGRPVNPGHLTRLLLCAKRYDEALDWAERALENRRGVLAVLQDRVDTNFWAHPRHAGLLERARQAVD